MVISDHVSASFSYLFLNWFSFLFYATQTIQDKLWYNLSPWCGSTDFYLMWIRIRLFTLMQIRIQILASKKGSNSWKSAQIGSYSIHFGLSSANWCGSGSISGSSLSLWCRSGSWFLSDADEDPGYKNDALDNYIPKKDLAKPHS